MIEPCISAQENEILTSVPIAEEIWKVIFEMNPLKAPGPNGMTGLYYRRYWQIVGDQLVAVVQSFFRDGWLLQESKELIISTSSDQSVFAMLVITYMMISKILA